MRNGNISIFIERKLNESFCENEVENFIEIRENSSLTSLCPFFTRLPSFHLYKPRIYSFIPPISTLSLLHSSIQFLSSLYSFLPSISTLSLLLSSFHLYPFFTPFFLPSLPSLYSFVPSISTPFFTPSFLPSLPSFYSFYPS